MAIVIRGGSVAGVVFHSDQGSEYTGRIFAAAVMASRIAEADR